MNWLKPGEGRPPVAPTRALRGGFRPGRVSDPQMLDLQGRIQSFISTWSAVSPTVDRRIVEFMINACYVDPTISNVRKQMKHLALTPFRIVVEDRSDSDMEKIHNRLNEMTKRLQMKLIAHRLMDQALSTGAISAEYVISDRMDMIDQIVQVPVTAVEFKNEDGIWQPYQSQVATGKSIRLDTRTYKYLAFETIEGSPYAIPPFLASAMHILIDTDITGNLRFIFRKFGILGVVSFLMNMPDGYDWEDPEQVSRMQDLISQRATDLDNNYHKGLLVSPNDGTFTVTNPSGEARGASDLMDRVTEGKHAGAGIHGGIFGQSSRPADKFANVIYRQTVHYAESFQDLIELYFDNVYETELVLGGIDPTGVRSQFEDNPAFDPLSEAQARTTEISGDLMLLGRGACDIEDIAQKYYNKPAAAPERAYLDPYSGSDYEPEVMGEDIQSGKSVVRHSHAGAWGRGKSAPPLSPPRNSRGENKARVEFEVTGSGLKVVVPFAGNLKSGKKKTEVEMNPANPLRVCPGHPYGRDGGTGLSHLLDNPIDRAMIRRRNEYVRRLRPHLNEATDEAVNRMTEWLDRMDYYSFRDEEEFALRAWQVMAAGIQSRMQDKAVAETVGKIIDDSYKHYRLRDTSVWGAGGAPIRFSFQPRDQRALQAIKGFDSFYLGKFVDNDGARRNGLAFLKKRYLEDGAPLFGRADPEVLNAFRASLGRTAMDMGLYETQRIADTSVVRMRSYGQLNQMWEAGVTEAEWIRVGDYDCPICGPFEGRRFNITNALIRVDREVQMSPDEFESYLRRMPSGVRQDVQGALNAGEQPPLHPYCRCRLVAVIE